MSLPIHPLADLFPLIEGAEFDELVASVKAHGLWDPITLLDGAILDGRNRYRACQAAGVKPRFEDFAGDDPYAFVIDKNVRRRHLSPSQLGMIGARMETLKLGDNQHTNKEGRHQCLPSTQEVAEKLDISPRTLTDAKVVLNEGTDEEIRAADEGRKSAKALAAEIRARAPDKHHAKGRTPERINNQQMNAQIWNNLREGLTLLGGLPLPADVVRIARQYDKRTDVISARLPQTLNWLKEFAHEWSNRNGSADEEEQASGDYADAGSRDRAA